jgi:hypothetical protein
MSHPETGDMKRLSTITSSYPPFRDDFLPEEKKLISGKASQPKGDHSQQFLVLQLYPFLLVRQEEKRQQERTLSLERRGKKRQKVRRRTNASPHRLRRPRRTNQQG